MLPEDIAIQFLATLFGVLMGLPVALIVDRRVTSNHIKKEGIDVLRNLRIEITQNSYSLNDILHKIDEESIYLKNIQMIRWNSKSVAEFAHVFSSDIISALYDLYNDFEVISKKVDLQYSLYGSLSLKNEEIEIPEELIESLKQQIPSVIIKCNNIQKKLADEILALEKSANSVL
jgi:hypothetical protein